MNRFFPLALCFFLFSIGLSAQRVNQCGFKIPPRSLVQKFASVYEAQDVIKAMLDTIKWKENFMVKEQNGINNAYATIQSNRRWIVYDNHFLENMDAYTGTKWASYSVVAHEIGHHYYNHVLDGAGSTPPREIEADYFSGYVMGRMGASLNEAKAAMEKLGTDVQSRTHPAKADRLASITKGWNYAKTNVPTQTTNTGNTNTGNTNTGNTNQDNTNTGNTGTQAGSAAEWIYLTHGNNAPLVVELSDDGRKFQEVELKNGEPFVFKFDIYKYGWMRVRQMRTNKVYRLNHGMDYTLQWSRRQQSWVLLTVN